MAIDNRVDVEIEIYVMSSKGTGIHGEEIRPVVRCDKIAVCWIVGVPDVQLDVIEDNKTIRICDVLCQHGLKRHGLGGSQGGWNVLYVLIMNLISFK